MPPLSSGAALSSEGQSKGCVLCEFVLNVLEKMVLDNNTHIEVCGPGVTCVRCLSVTGRNNGSSSSFTYYENSDCSCCGGN